MRIVRTSFPRIPWRFVLSAALASASLFRGVSARAQYAEYPKKVGQFQPLQSGALPEWMTLDMELRGRAEDQTAYNNMPGRGKFYLLSRVRGGIEVRPSSWLTGYLQFHDEHALGLPLKYVMSNMRETFDVREAFVELHYKPVKLFAGRQQLNFGDERVVGISDWTNTSRTWDGFDLRLGSEEKNRLDLFSTSVVKVNPTSLDTHGAGLTFHGAEGSITTLVRGSDIEPFVLVRTAPRVLGSDGRYGGEVEVTPGIFAAGSIPGGFDFSVTGDLQRGSYAGDTIRAGAGIVKIGFTARALPWTPRVQGEYDYATGNSHRTAGQVSTYDQQYPSNHDAFGLVDLFGFQNIKQDRVNFSLLPRRNLSFLFQAGSLHLASTSDSVYGSAGDALVKVPANGFLSDDIGTEFDASAKHVFHKYLVTNVGLGHLFPGAAMTHSGHAAPLTVGYFSPHLSLHREQARPVA